MERNRQTKLIAIVALCVAVVGLTLGFAAFSNTLTISSSASVTPNESDFKMVIYGLAEEESGFGGYCDENICTSKTYSVPLLGNKATATNAIIDNDNLTIKDLNFNVTSVADDAQYVFKIVNEGKYDAYLLKSDFVKIAEINANKQCIAGEGTTIALVEDACSNIELSAAAETVDGQYLDSLYLDSSDSYIKVSPNDYIAFNIYFASTRVGVLADGEFTVKFDDIKLNFSTVEPTA